MYAKLALRNVRRSLKDYLIYLLTMTLSVGLFYGFLSITSPFYNDRLPIQMNLEYFSGKIRIIIPLIAVLLVFLISYVNRYMIRRRKKEFALQSVMGMEQRTVAHLFFLEMLIMGLAAIGLGILLGVLLSQIVSAIVMASFGEAYQFYFFVYPDTIGWTLLFYALLFVLIGIGNIQTIRKQKIIDLLQDDHKTESTTNIRDILFFSLLCITVLSIVILSICFGKVLPFWSSFNQNAIWSTSFALLSSLIFLLLSGSFFLVTARKKNKGSILAVLLTIFSLITAISLLRMQGLMDELLRLGLVSGSFYTYLLPLLAIMLILFSILGFFSCLSWLLTITKRKYKPFKYRNLFLLGQIISKLKTNSKTMSVLTCALIFSLILLGWMPTFTDQVNGYLSERTIHDVQVFSAYGIAEDVADLSDQMLDYAYLDQYLEKEGYKPIQTANVEVLYLDEEDFKIRVQKDIPILGISLSDYNALLLLSGYSEISLPENNFAVTWANTALPEEIKEFDKQHPEIEVGNKSLTKYSDGDFTKNIGMGIFTSGMKAVYILPDSICENLTVATFYYAANTTNPLSYNSAVKISDHINEWFQASDSIEINSGYVRLKTLQLNEGISNALMFRLGTAYASFVLIIICLTVLSLQQLMDASEHKYRFLTINKLGVDHIQIKKLIRQQMSVWFGIPILTSLIGAGVTLIYLMVVYYRSYIPYMTVQHVARNILIIYGTFIFIILCYVTFTYSLFKRNIGINK